MAQTPTAEDWTPASCTLPTTERPLRVAEFDELFRAAVQRSTRPEATRLDLLITADSEPFARDLAGREMSCCSFFRFDFDPSEDGVVIRIDVPAEHVDVLDALQARVAAVVCGSADTRG